MTKLFSARRILTLLLAAAISLSLLAVPGISAAAAHDFTGAGTKTAGSINATGAYFSETASDIAIAGGVTPFKLSMYFYKPGTNFIDADAYYGEQPANNIKFNVYRKDASDAWELIYTIDRVFRADYFVGEGTYRVTLATNDTTLFPHDMSNPYYNDNSNTDIEHYSAVDKLKDEINYGAEFTVGADGKYAGGFANYGGLGNNHTPIPTVGAATLQLNYKYSLNSIFRIYKTDQYGTPLPSVEFKVEHYNMWYTYVAGDDISTNLSAFNTTINRGVPETITTGSNGYTDFISLPFYSWYYRITELNPPDGAVPVVFYIFGWADGSISLMKPNVGNWISADGVVGAPPNVSVNNYDISTYRTTVKVENTLANATPPGGGTTSVNPPTTSTEPTTTTTRTDKPDKSTSTPPTGTTSTPPTTSTTPADTSEEPSPTPTPTSRPVDTSPPESTPVPLMTEAGTPSPAPPVEQLNIQPAPTAPINPASIDLQNPPLYEYRIAPEFIPLGWHEVVFSSGDGNEYYTIAPDDVPQQRLPKAGELSLTALFLALGLIATGSLLMLKKTRKQK